MSRVKVQKSPFYRGNQYLHKKGINIEYTKEQLLEIKRCREDIVYFASKYFTIVHIDKGKIIIPLTDYQKELLRTIQDNRFAIILQSRQSYKTTTLTISILHYILFNDDKEVALLGNKEKQAKGVLSRIKLAYELLPMWLKHGVTAWNKKSIKLANDCLVTASSTSSDSIRGDSISFLFIDECAFIDNWEEFYTSTYPVISSGKDSRIVLVSTANGMNHFYKMYEDARRGRSSYKHFKVDWMDVPGRDEEWKEETINNTSEEAFMQEHENIFLGSSNTLISIKSLHSLVYQEPIYDNKSGMVQFKKPEKDHTYVAVVDTSRGSKNDYSALSIIDITQYPFEQVARYRNNAISYTVYPDIIYRLVKEYNDAWVVVENNDIGGHVVTQLNADFDYEYLVNDSTKKYELGVRTTKKTKNTGCSNIKDLIERNQLIVNDFETISEFSTFEEKGSSYEAVKGHNDDLAMGMVLFGWFTSTELFEEIANKRIKRDVFKEDLKSIYEKLLPQPMIVDGLGDNEPTYHVEGGEVWQDDDSGFRD